MMLLIFILSQFAAISLLFLCSYVFGRRLTRDFLYNSVWEEISISTSMGLGVIACLVFFSGIIGFLYSSAVLTAIVILQLVCYQSWIDLYSRIKFQKPKKTLIGALLLTIIFAPSFLFSLFPPTAFDSIMYHLPFAKIYIQNHQIVPAIFTRYSFSPQTNEMLFTLMMLFDKDVGAQLVQWLMMLLVSTMLIAWGCRVFSFQSGLWAAALWLATPLVILLGTSAYIDIGLTLFVTLTAYSIFNWITTKEKSWLIFAAVFCGLAVSSKYSALIFLGIFGLIVLYRSIRESRFSDVFIFSIIAGSIAAPWYLRNFYYTGNPLFPFMASLFGYSYWNAGDIGRQLTDWANNGIRGRSYQFYYDGLILAFPTLLILPIVIFFGIKNSYIKALLALVLIFVLFWLTSASLPRYLLPVLPLVCLATAASLILFIKRISFLRNATENNLIVFLIALLIILPGWLFAAIKVHKRLPLPTDQQQRDVFLSQQLDTYPIYKFLNEQRGKNYKVYAYFDSNMAYYADGKFMGDWFGPARFQDVLDNMQSGETLFRKLKDLEADYFLVRTNGELKATLPNDDFFRANFKPVLITPQAVLYELKNTL